MRMRQAIGRHGEDLAARYVANRGWRVLDRNWWGPSGELDLVALDEEEDQLVGIEVKTRRSLAYGDPTEAVTPTKVARVRRLTAQWLAAHDVRCDSVRVDVITVMLPTSGPPDLRHIVGVL